MSSLTRSEYRHEEQRRVTESPFKETKWDRHLDTLLTDLNESVGSGRSPASTQQRSLVPAAGSGLVTESHGAPGSGDFHERREYTSPDQRTHVVEERFEKSGRGDSGKPSATFYYETQPGSRYHSSKTTYQRRGEEPSKQQNSTPFGSKPSSNYRTTETVQEYHQQNKPHTTVQYHETNPSAETKTQSHYQTIRTVSELPTAKQPKVIEYTEELLPAEPRSRSQYRTTTRTITERQDKSPTTHTYYEQSPSVERRNAKTVTEYRYPVVGSPQQEALPPLTQHYTTKSTTEYVDGVPGGARHPGGAPMTIRYVDKKPITIYHDASPGQEMSPPLSPRAAEPAPAPAPPTVYYERIIERQPIIHYYGGRPQESEPPRHYTLPASQHYTTTQHAESSSQHRSSATLPAGQLLSTSQLTQHSSSQPPSSSNITRTPSLQRPPRALSPDVTGGTVPGRLFVSNRYETNNGQTTNRWPTDERRLDYAPARRAHDLRSPDAVRCEPDYGRGYVPGYGPGRGVPGPRSEPRSPDTLRSEPDYARGYDFPRRGLPDDLRSEPDYAGHGGHGGEPEPSLWRGRAGSMRSVTSAPARQPVEPFGRRYGSARAPNHGRRSPPYAEVYRSTTEPYRSTTEAYRSTGESYRGTREPYRSTGEPYRGTTEPYRGTTEPYRGTGEPYRSTSESYGYSRPYQPSGAFARALSPVQPASNRPTNDNYRLDSNQSVTKQVYKTSSYSSDSAAPQTQAPSQQPADPSRFKQNILELDSLLDDLDHARKKPGTNGVDTAAHTYDGPAGTSTPYRHTNIQKTTKTSKYVTSGPGEHQSTPGDQLTTLGLTGPRHSPSPNPLDGLDRSLVPELSEPPAAGTTRVTKYEYRSSNRREVSPQPVPAPAPVRTLPPPESSRTTIDRREFTSATNTMERPPPPDTTDKTTTYMYNAETTGVPGVPGVPTPPVPAGQPGSNTTINYHIYNYGTLGPDGQPVVLPPGVPPPAGGTLPRQEVNTNTSNTTSTYQYREASPPPQRSPAPGPDTTVSNSYVFEKHTHGGTPQRHPSGPSVPSGPGGPGGPSGSGGPGGPNVPNVLHTTSTTTKHYTIGPDGREIPARPSSPYDQQYPKFPVEDGPQGKHTRTTTTTIERTQTRGSPFPARSPSPSGRRPQRDDGPRVPFPGSPRRPVDDIDTPRRVDELMAQIPDTPQDGTYPRGPIRRELNNGRSSTTTTHFTVHETEPLLDTKTQVTLDAKSGAVVPQAATKPVSGPPIYYPPGSTEFKPKPESEMMFQSYESRGGGKYASGYKAKGKYKAKGGSKESHAEGGAVIPICLPLCCGAACSVM